MNKRVPSSSEQALAGAAPSAGPDSLVPCQVIGCPYPAKWRVWLNLSPPSDTRYRMLFATDYFQLRVCGVHKTGLARRYIFERAEWL